jgi:hypothetical protein
LEGVHVLGIAIDRQIAGVDPDSCIERGHDVFADWGVVVRIGVEVVTTVAGCNPRHKVVLAQASAVAARLVCERGGVIHTIGRAGPRVLGPTVAADARDWVETRDASGGVQPDLLIGDGLAAVADIAGEANVFLMDGVQGATPVSTTRRRNVVGVPELAMAVGTEPGSADPNRVILVRLGGPGHQEDEGECCRDRN